MPGQVCSIKYLLLLNAEILFCGSRTATAIWYRSVLLWLPFTSTLTFFFLTFYSLGSRTNDFLSFHILREGRRSTRSSDRTHAHNVSLIGRQVQAGSLLCPFHTGHAIHAIRPYWEDRPERSVNRAATMTRREQWPTTWPSRLHFFRPSAISSL